MSPPFPPVNRQSVDCWCLSPTLQWIQGPKRPVSSLSASKTSCLCVVWCNVFSCARVFQIVGFLSQSLLQAPCSTLDPLWIFPSAEHFQTDTRTHSHTLKQKQLNRAMATAVSLRPKFLNDVCRQRSCFVDKLPMGNSALLLD